MDADDHVGWNYSKRILSVGQQLQSIQPMHGGWGDIRIEIHIIFIKRA
jgi:hypothetical protein